MKLLVLLLFVPFITFAKSFVPNSFTANFEQSTILSTGKVSKTHGKISYQYPGHLRFEVTDPVQNLVIINPQKTWVVNFSTVKTEKDQANVSKTSNFPLIKFFDSVKDGLENSKLFRAKYEKNSVVLNFDSKAQEEMGIQSVTLNSKSNPSSIKELKDFESISINRPKSSKTTYKFSAFNSEPKLSSEEFDFKPNSNTKVIEN